MGRAETRAKIQKLNKRFTGIHVTKGNLEVPVDGYDEPLLVDINNFDTIYHLSEMCDKFSDIDGSYPEETAAAKALEDEKAKVVAEFKEKLKVATDDEEEAEIRSQLRVAVNDYDNKIVRHSIRLYKKVISDFTIHVDAVFGDGATMKIFGNKSPMPNSIAEFIEDISPVVEALSMMFKDEEQK